MVLLLFIPAYIQSGFLYFNSLDTWEDMVKARSIAMASVIKKDVVTCCLLGKEGHYIVQKNSLAKY